MPDTIGTGGTCGRGTGGAMGHAGLGDGGAAGRKGGGDRMAQVMILGRGDAAVGTRRVHQLLRVLAVASGERGRQVGPVVVGGGGDPADA